jgi:fermentation-respiration switch protein FrsA (DUF1100 family)
MSLYEEFLLDNDGILLSAALCTPDGPSPQPGLILCHGMPATPRGDNVAPSTPVDIGYPELARLSAESGFATLIFNFRGAGSSTGNYHPLGWTEDLAAVIDWMQTAPKVDGSRIAVMGSSMGAAIAIYVSAHREDVAALVTYAAPARLTRPANVPESIARHRQLGIINDNDFPPSLEAWAAEFEQLDPLAWISEVSPVPLLVMHGSHDDLVSPDSATILFEQAREPKNLHLLAGAGHRFRSEPQAMSDALTWLRSLLISGESD